VERQRVARTGIDLWARKRKAVVEWPRAKGRSGKAVVAANGLAYGMGESRQGKAVMAWLGPTERGRAVMARGDRSGMDLQGSSGLECVERPRTERQSWNGNAWLVPVWRGSRGKVSSGQVMPGAAVVDRQGIERTGIDQPI